MADGTLLHLPDGRNVRRVIRVSSSLSFCIVLKEKYGMSRLLYLIDYAGEFLFYVEKNCTTRYG